MKASLIFLAALALAPLAQAGDLDLIVRHEMVQVGADGVTREARFSERVYRRADFVWTERVLPAGAHAASEHAAQAKEHKHLDLAASARWVQRTTGAAPQVQLVNPHDKVVIDVPPAEFGNIGFDGNWNTAYHLIDPKRIAGMARLAEPAPAGTAWYGAKTGDGQLRVLWDEAESYPRRIEGNNGKATARNLTVVERSPRTSAAPWKQAGQYPRKDYSDYLD